MIACVWVHVGCLRQIHEQSCQQQDRMVNTKVCKVNTCTLCVCTTSHGNASRTCVRHHCMVVCVCLYLYDCMCMVVWQCAHDVMMTNTRSYTDGSSVSSNMIAFVSIHVGWDTWWGSGRFRCRYLLRFRKVPVQTPGQLLEGSCADTCCGSWPWFFYHCAAPLHACMCMIVSVWLYVYDCMAMCTWCHHKSHMTTRVSNSVQSNMTAYVWVHLFDDNDARSHGGVF